MPDISRPEGEPDFRRGGKESAVDEVTLVRAVLGPPVVPAPQVRAAARASLEQYLTGETSSALPDPLRRIMPGRKRLAGTGPDRNAPARRRPGRSGPGRSLRGRSGRGRSGRGRARLGLIGLGVTAACVAVAVAVAIAVWPGGAPARPLLAQAASPVGEASDSPVLIPGGNPGDTVHGPSARAFLLAMALKVGQAPVAGQYWCMVTVNGTLHQIGSGATVLPVPWLTSPATVSAAALPGYQYSVLGRYRSTVCLKASDFAWNAGYTQDLGSHPATAADTAAWRRAGAPQRWRASDLPALDRYLSAKAGQPSYYQESKPVTAPWGGPETASSLPADPAELKAFFVAHGGPSTNPEEALADDCFEVLQMPFPPAVQAAAFRVLAGIPGIRMIPGATGPEGQVGTALRLPWRDWNRPAGMDFEDVLTLIDPATGHVIALEWVANQQIAGLSPGTVLSYQTTSYQWVTVLPSWAHPGVGPPKASG